MKANLANRLRQLKMLSTAERWSSQMVLSLISITLPLCRRKKMISESLVKAIRTEREQASKTSYLEG